MNAAEQIEGAVVDLLTSAFSGFDEDVTLFPYVAQTDDPDPQVKMPAVQFAADPFTPTNPSGSLGYVSIRLEARTQADDDPTREQLQDVFDAATAKMTADLLGPLVMDPWLICGIDDTEEGGVSVDPDSRTQAKGKAYRIAVAKIT